MNNVKIDGNEVENGYIFKTLNNRMSNIEESNKYLKNLLKNLQVEGEALDLKKLAIKIDNMIDKTTFLTHLNDSSVHLDGEMRTFLNNNDFISRKEIQIIKVSNLNTEITHALKTNEIYVNILDLDTNEYYSRRIISKGLNSFVIKFSTNDLGKKCKIIILS